MLATAVNGTGGGSRMTCGHSCVSGMLVLEVNSGSL